MKLILTLTALLTILGINYSDVLIQKNPVSNKNQTIQSADQNWYNAALNHIEMDEYNISFNDKLGTYQSPNRANNTRFIYQMDGFTVKSLSMELPQRHEDSKRETPDVRREKQNEWSIDFKLSDVKRQTSDVRCQTGDINNSTNSTNLTDLTNRELSVAGNKASVENENIRIDYTNSKEGMRQDFIIKNKPEGEGNLKLNLSADTKLNMMVDADAVKFLNEEGKEKIRYSALKVWDANGDELLAYFEQNDKLQIANDKLQIEDQSRSNPPAANKDQKSFTIVVNDKDATYPITIDPLSTSPDWTVETDQIEADFGRSVASAGDVNNDGYSDVIIGAQFYINDSTKDGKVFVFYGSAAGLSDTANWTAEAEQINSLFGYSVASAGDVNNDDYSDVIISARGYDNVGINSGKVYVYLGSETGLSDTANWTAESVQAGANFGQSVSSAGDVNGDDYDDVIIGAQAFDEGENDEGKVYVYFGSSSGLSITPDWTAQSNQNDAEIGSSVASAGDVNNDGYSDIMVGARYYTENISEEGAAFVWYGSSTGLGADGFPGNADWSVFGDQDGAGAGGCVSGAGDVNGDGYSDVIVGITAYDNGENNEGIANLYFGSDSGISETVNWSAESNQVNAFFGASLSCAGDVNGDGYSDVIVGAPQFDNADIKAGKAYLYLGSSSGLSDSADWTAEGDHIYFQFGRSVSSAGDVNGDGFSDVIVGAPSLNITTNFGKVFAYYGSGPSALQLDLTMFIQGFYNSSTDMMVGDTVTVYLRNSSSPYAIVDSAKAFVDSSGLATYSFLNAVNATDYYIHLKHRNSIETWSKTPQQFTGSALSYDFITANTQAFGDNMADIDASPVRFGIYGGDENQDGIVDLSDVVNVSNAANAFINGYVVTDMNGDNITDLSDLVITSNNGSAFISSVTP